MQYLLYKAPGKVDEMRKVEENRKLGDYRKQAFEDAMQWKLIYDDVDSEKIMFMSEVCCRVFGFGSTNTLFYPIVSYFILFYPILFVKEVCA